MNRRRLFLLILVFLLLLLLLLIGAYFFLGENVSFFGEPTPTPTAEPTAVLDPSAPTPIPTVAIIEEETVFVDVVVSVQTVPRGFQFTLDELTVEQRLASLVKPNVITDTRRIVGQFARKDIYQGETITTDSIVSDLKAVGQEDYGPSSLIPPGFVAMSVPVDRLGGVAGALAPGDNVDILISFLVQPVDEQFQTPLHNDAVIYVTETREIVDENGETSTITVEIPFFISPLGRFEDLPTGDLANIVPSEEFARGQHIAFVIQNARVINVGEWTPAVPPLLPTPTFTPEEEEEAREAEINAAETGGVVETTESLTDVAQRVQDAITILQNPNQSDTVLIALPPQQQLALKYAVETNSVIDFALRGEGDGQLYAVENVSLDYVLERFNIDIPPNFNFVVFPEEGVFDFVPETDAPGVNNTTNTEETTTSTGN
ncbi:MAG: RcpC/CpaB family pilus assembly protein [Chloroflexota bacterium]